MKSRLRRNVVVGESGGRVLPLIGEHPNYIFKEQKNRNADVKIPTTTRYNTINMNDDTTSGFPTSPYDKKKIKIVRRQTKINKEVNDDETKQNKTKNKP